MIGLIGSLDVSMAGIFSENGALVDGTLSSSSGLTGTFTGSRKSIAPTPTLGADVVDVQGQWNFTVEGTVAGSCDVTITQGGARFFATLVCDNPTFGSGTLGGTILGDRSFTATGVVGSFVQVAGTFAADGNSLDATWNSFGFTGTFTGSRKSIAPAPTPTQTQSPAATTSPAPTPTPTHVADVLDLTGDWNFAVTGRLVGTCHATTMQSGASFVMTVACSSAALGSGTLSGTIQGDRSFTASGVMAGFFVQIAGVAAEDGNSMTGSWSSSSGFTGTFTGVKKPASGDVDCDGEVTSIDAALILQLDVGLVSALLCQFAADVNGDGAANSLDAALALQIVVGLIPVPS